MIRIRLRRKAFPLQSGLWDGHGPVRRCRHGPGLSCGHNTRSYRCDVGNKVGSSNGGDIVWVYDARPMSVRPRDAIATNQTQVKFSSLLNHNSCGAKRPRYGCYRQLTIDSKHAKKWTAIPSQLKEPGHRIQNARTARLSPKYKDERIKKFSTWNPLLNVRVETPALNTARRQCRLPM